MAEKKKAGKVGRLWTKHGGGYYALVAVGTFLYLEVVNLWSGISGSGSVQAFVVGEMVTFGIETVVNTFFASFWPVYWFTRFGLPALLVGLVGYLVWTTLLAAALSKRENQMRKELGL